ncbi:hypothetical protein A2791_01175 [Candidatus Saccharibacteria bacterium RIFCSPHIGHO2_01_FULL_46_30]|nr:MAG: hypothetical protein A2791_01175 [Candidatus Saccharibacteria bacterium RIFCSPHIGHO2_01_FULL_46_30]
MSRISTNTSDYGTNLIVHKKLPPSLRYRLEYEKLPPLFAHLDERTGTFHIDTHLMVAEIFPYREILDAHTLLSNQVWMQPIVSTLTDPCFDLRSLFTVQATISLGDSRGIAVTFSDRTKWVSLPNSGVRAQLVSNDEIVSELGSIQALARGGIIL